MDRETVALFGYGYWGKKLYRYLREDERFDLRYVYFRSLKKYSPEERRDQFGEAFVADPERIWRDDTVRSVVVATPIKTHFTLGEKALTSGKNLLMEKPLALTTEEALTLQRLSRENDLKVLTEYTYTFSRSLLKAREIIRGGEVGNLRSIHLTLKQTGRFLEYDVYWLLATHLLSILDIFVPLKRLAFSKTDMMCAAGRVESGLICFTCGDGSITGYCDVSLNNPVKDMKVVLYGEKGSVIYTPVGGPTLKAVRYRKDENVPGSKLVESCREFDYDERNNLKRAIDTFYDVLRAKEDDNMERAIAVTEVVERLSPFTQSKNRA